MRMQNDDLRLNNRQRTIRAVKSSIRFIFALAISLLFLFPVFWMISGSLKTEAEILAARPSLFPAVPYWHNYSEAMRKEPFMRYMLNTLIVTVGTLSIEILTSVLAAYSFGRGQYRGKHALFIYVLGAMMVPIQVTFVPLYIMISHMGLKNTYLGLIIVGCVSPYSIFMIRQAFMSVDESYLDAARVDGMGTLGMIFRVLVPMCKATIMTLLLVNFIGGWNSYFWPKIIANDKEEVRLLTIGMAHLKSSMQDGLLLNAGEVMAGAVISSSPVLIMFLVFQKQMLSGYTKAAMK